MKTDVDTGTVSEENAFLQLVAESRDRRRREIDERAHAEARDIVRVARRDAKRRVSEATRDNRRRSHDAVDLARAKRDAEVRLALQQANRRWLDRAWPELVAALSSAWSDPQIRTLWISAAIDRALGALSSKARFRIDYPSNLDNSDLLAGAHAIELSTGTAPELRPDPELSAGVRITADGATLDASITGLLAHREVVEGRLLAELRAAIDVFDPGAQP